ncbi:1-phosphatidylinositol phosphodiesterase [Rhodotorula toruloides]|uniref:1-phosphatidylinositol phosphodiesterase n=1 Tax=Rhodotorula toruloides TaxID=5286 RepID=A0A511KF56_RHOTO|nr:1-phosphatidylinositol phosphodiesterase [Rhodotorula toruloides]
MLDELYIPGSHETLALHYPLLSSLCQTLPLTSQLTLGIRFLDLRFNLTQKGELWAYHGLVPQRRRAEEVFGEVYSWLEGWEGRQETVIVSIKQENDTPPDLFASVLISLIRSTTPLPSSPSNRTPESLWYTQKEWPQLGDVRGKAVLFCRFAWKGYGLHPVRWLNDQHVAWTTEIGGRDSLVQDWPPSVSRSSTQPLHRSSPLQPPKLPESHTEYRSSLARPSPLFIPQPPQKVGA